MTSRSDVGHETTLGMQLTIDGREVAHPAVAVKTLLTDAQCEILRWIKAHGFITSTQAGIILHGHHAARVAQQHPNNVIREHRRPYASSDGSEAMRRLARRGLVVRVEPGAWWLSDAAPDITYTEPTRRGGRR